MKRKEEREKREERNERNEVSAPVPLVPSGCLVVSPFLSEVQTKTSFGDQWAQARLPFREPH